MAEEGGSITKSRKRCGVVTGGNKGIGLEICRELGRQGVTVVLTARDVKRGTEAVDKLVRQDQSLRVLFHQLDVTDQQSVDSLAHFITTQFGKLDILVNNAGISGVMLDPQAMATAAQLCGGWPGKDEVEWKEIATQTYELAVECVQTNYYGAKRMVEAVVPLLYLSDSPRIVNVSSTLGLLQNIPSEWAKGVLGDENNVSEEGVDKVLNEFLGDMKEGLGESKRWPPHFSAYILSKASMNAYTRILAKKLPRFRINSVCPGFVRTDITCSTGLFTADQGAQMPVRLALLPDDGPSGFFFRDNQVSPF